MFEIAENSQKLSKREYKARLPDLRVELLRLQRQLADADFPVLLLISGIDGGGKGDIINLLNEWMDPRYIRTHAFAEPTEEERHRPRYWRYWMSLPKQGEIGIFVGSWYSDPISNWMNNESSHEDLDRDLAHINRLEKELTDAGMLIIKCWVHMSKKNQQKRFNELKKDPRTRWRVSKRDQKHLKLYDEFVALANRVLKKTDSGNAPWNVIEGSDLKYSSVTVAEYLLARVNSHASQPGTAATRNINIDKIKKGGLKSFRQNSQSLGKREYNEQLEKYQGRLNRLARKMRDKSISAILVFEGWDAAGKGGAIRRITHALDARQYRVIPIAAPTDEEQAHHYLWRFWRHLPRAGKFTIYDRSWYGRVLVERVEKFATDAEWFRAYDEINDFEAELCEHGIVLLKFWLQIDKEEQLRRFNEREQIAYKQHKITDEDYRNREKWDEYEVAVDDMLGMTGTEVAPWQVIAANDKRQARIDILQMVTKAIEKAVKKID